MAEKPPAHPQLYLRSYTSAEYLSIGQRRQFLQILLQNPQLLRRADEKQILRLFHSFRFGDDKLALDVLGTWMQQRADVAPEIAMSYFDANQRFYRTVALYLVCRASSPEHYQIFSDKYLEMPDGRCCLSAAYSLAYCHIMAGKIDVWVELLNKKLKDESIAGEKRVNWLIARAHAQSIRNGGSYRYQIPRFDPLAGMNWLTEAHLVAEDDATRSRLYREEIARLAAGNSERRANQILKSATAKVPPQEVRAWRDKTEGVLKVWRDRRSEDARFAREAYVDTLAERKERADAQSDQEAAARYDTLLERAKVGVK